jgi:hypothetical protein
MSEWRAKRIPSEWSGWVGAVAGFPDTLTHTPAR